MEPDATPLLGISGVDGRYSLVRWLGSGSMGTVDLAPRERGREAVGANGMDGSGKLARKTAA